MASFNDRYGEAVVTCVDGSRFSFDATEVLVERNSYGTVDKVTVKGRSRIGGMGGGGGIRGAEARDIYLDEASNNRVAELAMATSMHLDLLDAARVEELKKLAIIKSLPVEDLWEDDSVLSISKVFKSGPKVYTYVVTKQAGLWYISGPKDGGRGGMTWSGLVDVILRDIASIPEIYEVTGWRKV